MSEYKYLPPKPPLIFTAFWSALLGAVIGFLTARGDMFLALILLTVGSVLFALLSIFSVIIIKNTILSRVFCSATLGCIGFFYIGLSYGIVLFIVGLILGHISNWLSSGNYRIPLPPYATSGEVLWFYSFRGLCALIFLFLIIPIIILIPLSFNQEPYFSFTPGMLALDKEAFSFRWYMDILTNGIVDPEAKEGWWTDVWQNAQWVRSIKNSFIIGIGATLLATSIGTLAAIGLSRSEMPYRRAIMALLISPMIVPLVITASGLFYFYSQIGIAKSYTGIILSHAILGTPFVIITVTATLAGFDNNLTRAAANLGAGPIRTFFKVQMPLILPGVISGGLFAFITSFDEVVIVMFMASIDQLTIPKQMWAGIRQEISPVILCMATCLVILSIVLLTTVELLRRRAERLRGIKAR